MSKVELKIFVASPNAVNEERNIVKKVVNHMNSYYKNLPPISLKVLGID
ncbi:MAG: hypothetical protein ACRCVG_03940 [Methanobacteriaceae archaeon]